MARCLIWDSRSYLGSAVLPLPAFLLFAVLATKASDFQDGTEVNLLLVGGLVLVVFEIERFSGGHDSSPLLGRIIHKDPHTIDRRKFVHLKQKVASTRAFINNPG